LTVNFFIYADVLNKGKKVPATAFHSAVTSTLSHHHAPNALYYFQGSSISGELIIVLFIVMSIPQENLNALLTSKGLEIRWGPLEMSSVGLKRNVM